MKRPFENIPLFDPTQSHRELRLAVREFAQKEAEPQALAFDKIEAFNLPLFQKMGERGFLGLLIEKRFGGQGRDLISSVIAHEELAFSDPGLSLAYLAHSVLCAHNISLFGSEELKRRALPRLSSGEWLGAMAISEEGCGTDVQSMRCQASLKGGKYIVSGRKKWITNGFVNNNPSDCCVLYCKLEDKIASLAVERLAGLSMGEKLTGKLGMRSSHTAELIFDRCEIPPSHLLQKDGLKGMMRILEAERLAISAIALGIGKRCLREMNRYSSRRRAFGQPLRSFGQIQRYIAQSHGELQALRSFVYSAAKALPSIEKPRLMSDSAKLMAGQTAKRIADRAIQALGGKGYMRQNHVERFWRDSKLLEIGGGSTEALEKNITKDLSSSDIF